MLSQHFSQASRDFQLKDILIQKVMVFEFDSSFLDFSSTNLPSCFSNPYSLSIQIVLWQSVPSIAILKL